MNEIIEFYIINKNVELAGFYTDNVIYYYDDSKDMKPIITLPHNPYNTETCKYVRYDELLQWLKVHPNLMHYIRLLVESGENFLNFITDEGYNIILDSTILDCNEF